MAFTILCKVIIGIIHTIKQKYLVGETVIQKITLFAY